MEKIKEIIELINQNDLDKAEKLTKIFNDNNSNSDVGLNLLATIYIKQKKFDQGVTILKKIVVNNPTFVPALSNLGIAYQHLNKFDESIDIFMQCIKINKEQPNVYNNLGFILNKKKCFKEAIQYLKKAIKYRPDFPEANYNLGISNFYLKKYDESEFFLNKAINLNNKLSEAFFFLGEIYRKKNHYDKALKFYLKSNEPKTTTRVLESLLDLGYINEYQKQIEKLSAKDPENRRTAAITSYLSHQYNLANTYPFCQNPLNFIVISNLFVNSSLTKEFLDELQNQIKEQDSMWETPERTTVHGYTTKGNLSSKNLLNLNKLQDLIDIEIIKYKEKFKKNNSLFIKNWPNKYSYYSWSNRLSKEGYNIPHIHPSGWLSGVFYLQVPRDIKNKEAGIEFSLHGDDYKIVNKDSPTVSLIPKVGDLILFPSSLYHKTIPFNSSEERICIAFDINKIK